MSDRRPPAALVDVHLVGLPLTVYRAAMQRHEELMREFALIALAEPDDTTTVPARLLALVDEVRGRFSRFSAPTQAQIEAAIADGRETIDVTFRVPAEAAEAAERLWALLDEADEFCRSGALLTLAASPEIRRYLRWYLNEFSVQTRGGEPTPWSAVGDGEGYPPVRS